MNKQEQLKQFVARALVAAVGGGALLTAAVAQAAPEVSARQYLATMSVQEYLEWLKKGGPVFCEMIDFTEFSWAEQVAVQTVAVKEVAVAGAVAGR